MKTTLHAIFFLVLLLPLGCTQPSTGSGDGDTSERGSYLSACSSDDRCAEGLSCLCGVCTVTCDADSACEARGEGSECAQGPSSCGEQGGGSICQAACEDAPDPGPTFCGDEQRRLPVPDARGCIAEWRCEDMDECPAQAPVPIELCEDGQEPQPVYDARGCILSFACPDPGCPDVARPQCPDPVFETDDAGCARWSCPGQECPDIAPPNPEPCPDGTTLTPTYDSAGCVTGFECAALNCPPVARPVCEDDEVATVATDAAGCPFWTCEPTDCPAIHPPAPDFCADGERISPTIDDRGCVVGYTCTGTGCDDVPDPGPSYCGDEQRREAEIDAAGCVVGWRCLDPICPDPIDPVCPDGQVARQVEDSAGCLHWFCEASTDFACGDGLTCDAATQYCFIEYPGQPGPIGYSCQPLPDVCLPDPSCACFDASNTFGDCTETAQGGLELRVYYP